MGKFSDILLTADFDRTLTAPDSSIPEENLRAIEYFMAEGGRLYPEYRQIPAHGGGIDGSDPGECPAAAVQRQRRL